MKLRPALRASGHEADERVSDLDFAADRAHAEKLREHGGLAVRVVGAQMDLVEPELVRPRLRR